MSERDELAKLAFIADNHAASDAHAEWDVLQKNPNYVGYVYQIADAILAAGYRKTELGEAAARFVSDELRNKGWILPRTITTAEELDALPFESVIRDGDECVLERWGDLEESGWVTVMVTSFVPRDQITLPATVLYEPEASK